ncbi:disulfide bond formation protein B [Aestuariispira insulae]|uniref:Disulfide bond formation protein DsbB n=1 Tax=Aestuariispira insulae TaxID=1461337 RepID=A0A3D9HP78_9PROT|nr:disulfide bond formation protein B [Aestuariispira insulae]RED51290.1 disulfide bond formation protein DsbB [Aestuariispira insulae]
MMRSFFIPANAILVTLAVAIAVLGGAYIFQYGFGYHPCELCLYQRLPWWIVIAIGCAAFWSGKRLPGLSNMLLILMGITLLVSTGLAGLHAGVEFKWWQGPTDCSSGPLDFDNLDDLAAAINAMPDIRCDEVPWSLFGISMAGYNFLISAALGLYALIVPIRNR